MVFGLSLADNFLRAFYSQEIGNANTAAATKSRRGCFHLREGDMEVTVVRHILGNFQKKTVSQAAVFRAP